MLSNKERYFECRKIYENLERVNDMERVELLKRFQAHIVYFKENNLDADALEKMLREIENDIVDPKPLLNSITQYLTTYEEKLKQFENGTFKESKNLLGNTFGFQDLVNLRNIIQWYLKRAKRAGIPFASIQTKLQKLDTLFLNNTEKKMFPFFQRIRMKWKGIDPETDERWWFYRQERSTGPSN